MITHPIIITDLDGTLLDHYSYSFKPALPVLQFLESQHIPVIANTSKTYVELIHIRKALKNHSPFIVENGAAIYLPKKIFPECPADCFDEGALWCYPISRPRQHWLDLLQQLRPRFNALFTSFQSLSDEQIASLTGLNLEQAHRAAQRQFGEPVLWHGNREDKEKFSQAVAELGGRVLQGGRFLHVGDNVNKGQAMLWLKALYQRQFNDRSIETIALGDSHNDIDMLEQADHAVIIASPSHTAPELRRTENVTHTQACGPEGWASALINLLDLPAKVLLEQES